MTREGLLSVGDIWLGEGAAIEIRAIEPELAEFFALKLKNTVYPSLPELAAGVGRPFVDYPDPNNRPTQPVQVLLDGEISALRTRFSPEFSAAEHWHDFDTWYFILDGSMRFGNEGIYESGDVRRVRGGFSYGPEEPGSEGVDFIIVSVGGPISLHWSDLECAPNGALCV